MKEDAKCEEYYGSDYWTAEGDCDDEYDDYVEAVSIDFDPSIVSYEEVIDHFFVMHGIDSGAR